VSYEHRIGTAKNNYPVRIHNLLLNLSSRQALKLNNLHKLNTHIEQRNKVRDSTTLWSSVVKDTHTSSSSSSA